MAQQKIEGLNMQIQEKTVLIEGVGEQESIPGVAERFKGFRSGVDVSKEVEMGVADAMATLRPIRTN